MEKKKSSEKVIVKFMPEDDGTLRHTIKVLQQPTPTEDTDKGPNRIVRSINFNDGIQIKRKYGEGAKPLFDREDVKVNTVADSGIGKQQKSFQRLSYCCEGGFP
ncbi:female-specific protein transformer-like isoform X2 [Musca autumnalis]|uniref:female-specific protein transformer-like isoform X2 n=1 Tax=Musca autumnalis TaxID=221902 RepID=UPI003CEFF314